MLLTILRIPFACLQFRCCCPLADASPISGDEMMWKVVRQFHRIVFRRVFVLSFNVMIFTGFLRFSEDQHYSVLFYVNLVIMHVWIFGLAWFLRVDGYFASGLWCVCVYCLCQTIRSLRLRLPCCSFSIVASSPLIALRSSLTLAFVLLEDAGAPRSIDLVLRTLFSSMVGVCCWTLIMWYGPSALGRDLLYVGLSVVFALFVLTASGYLSTFSSSSVLNSGVSRTRLSKFYLYLFCAAVNCLSVYSLMSFKFAKGRLRNMQTETLPDKSKWIADGKSSFVAPGKFLDGTKLNEDTPVNRWTCLLYAYVTDWMNMSNLFWWLAT